MPTNRTSRSFWSKSVDSSPSKERLSKGLNWMSNVKHFPTSRKLKNKTISLRWKQNFLTWAEGTLKNSKKSTRALKTIQEIAAAQMFTFWTKRKNLKPWGTILGHEEVLLHELRHFQLKRLNASFVKTAWAASKENSKTWEARATMPKQALMGQNSSCLQAHSSQVMSSQEQTLPQTGTRAPSFVVKFRASRLSTRSNLPLWQEISI